MKKFYFLFSSFLFVGIMISGAIQAQWLLQTNPLGTGQTAMVGKIQFVSANEGWIACGSNSGLLHTTDGGTNWNIVNPFPADVASNLSDPAVSMSWVNTSHGRALKTLNLGNIDMMTDANGAVLYNTTNGGNNWTRTAFPKTITTVTYSLADLQGNWQFHALTAKNPSISSSISGWMYGIATIEANGNCTIPITRSNGIPKSPEITLSISLRGEVSVNGDEIGYMSDDKQTIIMTSEEDNGGYSIYVLQKQVTGTNYTAADFQGNWQMHGLSSGNTENQYSGWVHAAMTGDSNGDFTGTFVGVGSGGNLNTSIAISSNGEITGLSSASSYTHGFMSVDKKSFYIIMTGLENNDYNLVVFQKQDPGISFTSADFQGIWREHTLITMNTNNSLEDNIKTTGIITGLITLNANGVGTVKNSASTDNISVTIDNDGLISTTPVLNGSTDIHGYMSEDKKTMVLTMTDTYGGFEISVLQKDVSVSGDLGLQTHFADENTGWVSVYNKIYDSFKIYKTTNGGINWDIINGPENPVGGFYDFVDANNGWLVGTASDIGEGSINNIFHTTNGGLSWTLQASNIGNANMIQFSDLMHGWVVGKNGLILKTIDGGNQWSPVTNTGLSNDFNSKSVYFLDANNGWIGIGEENTEGVGTRFILATNNGGASWSTQSTPVTNSIFSISFWDANHGWFTSDYGQIAQITTSTGLKSPNADKYTLYPNPSKDGFYIKSNENVLNVTILDLNGEVMLYKQIGSKDFFDISSLIPGIYFVKLSTKNEIVVRKIIKN